MPDDTKVHAPASGHVGMLSEVHDEAPASRTTIPQSCLSVVWNLAAWSKVTLASLLPERSTVVYAIASEA